MKLYRRVLGYLTVYPTLIVAAVVATAGFAAFDAFSMVMLIPFLNSLFGDAALPAEADGSLDKLLGQTIGRVLDLTAPPEDLLLGIIACILVVFLLRNVFDFFQNFLVIKLEQRVTRDLRIQVYGHLLDLDLRFFGQTRVGQVISRLTADADQLRTLVTRNIAKFATSIFQIVATLYLLLAMSIELTIVALVVLPGMFSVWGRLLRKLRRGDRTVLDMAGQITAHIQETLSGIRLVKASAAEDYERRRFRELTRRYYRRFTRTEALRVLTGPLTEMIGALGTVLILWFGSRLVLVEGSLGGGTFVAFLALSLRLYSPVKWLSRLPSIVQPGLVAAERVFEFLDTPVEISRHVAAKPFAGIGSGVRFEDVSFAYISGEPVLEDISFAVAPGQVVALVGPSGAGKTTLVDLVARFYDPTAGRIFVNDTDIREYDVKSYRSALGIVTQETVLFHDTLRANIAYGLEDVSDADVERAARTANAHDFIVQLPDGYDTIVGERGTRLSGGQRQRIAIARAILRDPPILIFDEATSALDSESERLVQEAIEQLLAGRTVFVIAHRLSTVQRADQILVLREGRIVERGRHHDLLLQNGAYRRLYELQQTAS